MKLLVKLNFSRHSKQIIYCLPFGHDNIKGILEIIWKQISCKREERLVLLNFRTLLCKKYIKRILILSHSTFNIHDQKKGLLKLQSQFSKDNFIFIVPPFQKIYRHENFLNIDRVMEKVLQIAIRLL